MKAKFGMIITAGYGKVGSFCVSRNRFGSYVKEWVVPANPFSTYSTYVRQNFATVSEAWRTLTDEERASWNHAGNLVSRTDNNGDLYTLGGFDYFMSINTNRMFIGSSILTTPPASNIPANNNQFTITSLSAGGSVEITLADPANDADLIYLIYATRNLSAGVNFVSTELRFFSGQAADGTASYNLFFDYIFRFPTFDIGKRVFIRLLTIRISTGEVNIPWTESAIITV